MKTIRILTGILISIFFLWLCLRNIEPDKYKDIYYALKQTNYFFVFMAVLANTFSFVFRAIRWRFLLSPLKADMLFRNVYSSVMTSFFLLYTLPARMGDFVRAYLIAKKEDVSISASFSTIVLERIMDGLISLAMFIVCVMIYNKEVVFKFKIIVPLSLTLNQAAFFMVSFFLGALIILILLKIFPEKTLKIFSKFLFVFPEKIKNKILEIMKSFIQGLSIFNNFRMIIITSALSLILWLFIGLSIYLALISFGIDREFYLAFIILGMLVLSVMIPAAPGFIGTYHFAAQLTLVKIYSLSNAFAFSCAWIIWLSSFIPVITLGFYEFNRENINFSKIRKK